MKDDDLPLKIHVQLWITPGSEDDFRAFEEQAFMIMRSYGVTDIRVSRPPKENKDEADEIHHIVFPSRSAFEAYRRDSVLRSLAALR